MITYHFDPETLTAFEHDSETGELDAMTEPASDCVTLIDRIWGARRRGRLNIDDAGDLALEVARYRESVR